MGEVPGRCLGQTDLALVQPTTIGKGRGGRLADHREARRTIEPLPAGGGRADRPGVGAGARWIGDDRRAAPAGSAVAGLNSRFTPRRPSRTLPAHQPRYTMGNLKKKRRLKMSKHKRRKRLKANRHKKRTWQK